MNNQEPSKFEFFINILNSIFRKKHLMIFVGHKEIAIIPTKNKKCLKFEFIKYSDKFFKQRYKKTLKYYKNYYITFILDNKEATLKHEDIPNISSLLKDTPIEKFVKKNYKPKEIVAYNVHDTSKKKSILHTTIASSSFKNPISYLMEYVIKKSFMFNGIYFLSLEMVHVINYLIQKNELESYKNDIQIFATYTKTSDIKIITKYKQQIFDNTTISVNNKSTEYIGGLIEQNIADKISDSTHLSDTLNAKISVIILTTNSLQKKLSNLSYKNTKIAFISPKKQDKNSNEPYIDEYILNIFNHSMRHISLNSDLKKITKLSLLNKLLFKPFAFTALGILIYLYSLYSDILIAKNKTKSLNNKYYQLSKEYRDVKKRHIEVGKIHDMVDFDNISNALNQNYKTPLNELKKITEFKFNNIKIIQFSWELNNQNNIYYSENLTSMKLKLLYKNKKENNNLSSEINLLNKHIFSNIKNYNYDYTNKDPQIIANNILIPVTYTFKQTKKDLK